MSVLQRSQQGLFGGLLTCEVMASSRVEGFEISFAAVWLSTDQADPKS